MRDLKQRTGMGDLRSYLPSVLTIFVSLQFAIHYVWKGVPFLDLGLFTREVIPLPYQGRILTAWILQLTTAQPGIAHALNALGAHLPIGLRSPYILVEFVLVLVALLGASYSCRATVRLLCGDTPFADWALLLTPGMLIYLTFFVSYGFYAIPYDLPSLAFFSVGIWLVVAERKVLLLPVFALGTLNRETFIFMTVFMLLYAWYAAAAQGQRHLAALRPTLAYAALQFAFWLASRFWLSHRFAGNAGGQVGGYGVVLQLAGNLRSLVKPFQWPALVNLAALFALPLVLGWPWMTNRAFAKATAAVLVLWTGGMLVVGVFLEVRVFTELIGFVAPCLAMALWTRFAEPARARLPDSCLP